ncbi:homoserine kinase [Umezawaea beigongshangensis]|uniref:homoserine kinase n=1 Tax=Umezawaea beigongshangensis TaxID=2780383 RepID=UPI0018F1EF23|nr:homoserine kinase [Umezawaea beigongshangensis]
MNGVRVTVPASTANLGSGFDALGMALAVHDVVDVRLVGHGLRVHVEGEGARDVPTDESHLVVRAFRAACARLDLSVPGLSLECRNAIPHSRGLGSSAAAAVAGVVAAHALAGVEPGAAALQLAAEFEGHADNAAASLLGGLVVAWSDGADHHAVRLDPHPDLRPVVLVPTHESSTKTTRGLLPPTVPHADAAFAAGRAALAVHALTRDPSHLLAATEDRLHQHYREPAWPATVRVVEELRAAGVPAAVSGAGPTVLALPRGGELPPGLDLSEFEVRSVPVDVEGVRVRPLG